MRIFGLIISQDSGVDLSALILKIYNYIPVSGKCKLSTKFYSVNQYVYHNIEYSIGYIKMRIFSIVFPRL